MSEEIKQFPNIELEDKDRFWEEFNSRHPDIFRQFVNTTFVNGSIGAFQPKTMDDNSYFIWQRFLKKWLYENGFWHKQIDLIYVSLNEDTNKGVRAIDTETIISIDGINDNLCSVTIKEADMEKPVTIFLKENVDELRKNVYIF